MNDERERRVASALVRSQDLTRTLNVILLTTVGGASIAGVVAYLAGDTPALVVCTIALAVTPIIGWLSRLGRHTTASLSLVLVFNGLAIYALITGGGIRDPAISLFPMVIIVSGILLVRRLALLLAALTVVSGVGVALAELFGVLTTKYSHSTALNDVFNVGVLLTMSAVLVDVLTGAVRASAKRAARIQEQVLEAEKLQAVGQLAGGVAHDFNNQLTGILANASLLQRTLPKNAEYHESLDAIIKCSRRSADLTQQLLAFARKGRHRNVVVDVDELVDDVTALLNRSIDKRITITHRSSPRAATIKGDPSFLQNAVLNLGLNARDAMPEGGDLAFIVDVLEARELRDRELASGTWVRLRVRDTGCGMDADVASQVFEPFFTTKASGNGMGLAAVYGTVRAHDGKIRVESKPGVGTTFTITLPLATGEKPERERAGDVHSQRFDGLRVLLAEDEAAVSQVTASLLEELGCTVTACADGAQALAALCEHPMGFDLAVLDQSMPLLSGAEVLREMRRRKLDLPVIATSGYVVEGDGPEHEKEPKTFLAKPFDLESLTKAMLRALRRDSSDRRDAP